MVVTHTHRISPRTNSLPPNIHSQTAAEGRRVRFPLPPLSYRLGSGERRWLDWDTTQPSFIRQGVTSDESSLNKLSRSKDRIPNKIALKKPHLIVVALTRIGTKPARTSSVAFLLVPTQNREIKLALTMGSRIN